VPWNGPEKEGECCNAKCHKYRHPNGATEKQLFDVWFTNTQGPERCCFTLAQKNEDGIQLVLVRDDEK
jgi:hypothetical protein